MPRIRILVVDVRGQGHRLDVAPGRSLMHAAVDAAVPGISGDCGGQASCASCHVWVDGALATALPPPSPDEAMLLEELPGRRPESRLACQLLASAELDGLVLRVPG